jgi:hypothetical protein
MIIFLLCLRSVYASGKEENEKKRKNGLSGAVQLCQIDTVYGVCHSRQKFSYLIIIRKTSLQLSKQ